MTDKLYPYFTIMVGLPGTGKSTHVKRYALPDAVILSTDNIIEKRCEFEGLTYSQGFKLFIDDATKQFNAELAQALKDRKNIMVDRTNLTVNSRHKLLARVPKDYKKYAMYVPIPEDWSTRLANRPGKCIPDSVISTMMMDFQMPTLDEGFDAVFTV